MHEPHPQTHTEVKTIQVSYHLPFKWCLTEQGRAELTTRGEDGGRRWKWGHIERLCPSAMTGLLWPRENITYYSSVSPTVLAAEMSECTRANGKVEKTNGQPRYEDDGLHFICFSLYLSCLSVHIQSHLSLITVTSEWPWAYVSYFINNVCRSCNVSSMSYIFLNMELFSFTCTLNTKLMYMPYLWTI